jgi:hypothetical protein
MKHGKKATAQRLFNNTLELIKEAELKRLASAPGASDVSRFNHACLSCVIPS